MLLLAFAASFFLVAISPGLCMTLSMSLGIRIGVRRTQWMMVGEVTGIAIVGACALLGVAVLLLQSPAVFTAFKVVGACYLFFLAWQSWHSEVSQLDAPSQSGHSAVALILQGFITAVANPKAWAFFVALLPPFINREQALLPQMATLLALMVLIEFSCLQIYARGGRLLNEQLTRRGKARWMNRVASAMMAGVGVWLLLS